MLILQRSTDRVLRNAHAAILACCQFGLQCDVFDAGTFGRDGGSDICSALRLFDGEPFVVGVQGSELVYPLLRQRPLYLIRSYGLGRYGDPASRCNMQSVTPGVRIKEMEPNTYLLAPGLVAVNSSCRGLAPWCVLLSIAVALGHLP
jgi:hypothetical protein